MAWNSFLDTDEKRFKLLSENAFLPSAQIDSPLHIGDSAGLPLDTSKTVELAFERDCPSKWRFSLGTKDDFSDSDISCDVHDTCSKTKRFGCFAASNNSIIDCPENQSATGDRRFQTLFICDPSIPLLGPPSTGPWVHEKPELISSENSPSANVLGFGSAEQFEFGLFAAMDCSLSLGTGLADALRRGTSMNECGLLGRGTVGDPHVWVDASMNISAFDLSSKDWLPVKPDSASEYLSFPHKVNDRDTCSPNCFFSLKTDHFSNVIICKESPGSSKEPCFPAKYQNCSLIALADSLNRSRLAKATVSRRRTGQLLIATTRNLLHRLRHLQTRTISSLENNY